MAKPPAITEAEWHVMRILWEYEGAGGWMTAAEVVEPVARERRIHHRTVRTLLARLVKKGAVETRAYEGSAGSGGGGGGYQYKARVSRDAVTRAESRSFLSRVFDGDAAPALVHLLTESREQLSTEQLEALQKLLSRKGTP
jgi:BlaI family penicillinase repressor